jgi:hypothetical protein
VTSRVLTETETGFQDTVAAYAHLHGWAVAHARPAQTVAGWRTPWQYDGKGFPDLILVRDRIVYAEIKTDRGRPDPDQTVWLNALAAAGGETYLWRPRDWPDIQQTLT